MATIKNGLILTNYCQLDEADLYICDDCAATRPAARYQIAELGDENLFCGFCDSDK